MSDPQVADSSSELALEGGGSFPIDGMEREEDAFWLALQRDSWSQSDDWFETTMRPRVERNLSHYKNQHSAGSKYNREEFKKRSRMFRPKTRTAVRKHAAAAVRAFFATADAMTCEPTDAQKEDNVLAAKIHEEVLNWRLSNSVPWFQITVAAMTEACINGMVISKSFWDYQEEAREVSRAVKGPDGNMTTQRFDATYVRHDRPMCRVVPIENVRISPASDWMDPVNSSPFVIEQRPYFVGDLMDRIMKKGGQIPYRSLSEEAIRRGKDITYDSIRSKREESRDRFSETFGGRNQDYDTIWVRECIVRVDGMDYYFETIGDNILLSDPIPLSRISKIGRGYQYGRLEIEPHTLNPYGVADLANSIQAEANEIANTRMDNVKLAMTGRFIVRRGSQTDIRSLMRNIPGSVTYSQATNDVREFRAADVTRSAYEEQDRLNLDMDDLLGTFSQSSVQSNRALNETVGGMNMLREGSNEISELEVRVFAETWYEPTLRDMVMLESYYESDKNVLKIAGEKYGQDLNNTFRLIQQPTKVTVNVGFGNTNPLMRIERLRVGLSTIEGLFPGTIQKGDPKEVAKEVFGALGFKDGSRFLPHMAEDHGEDPRVAQMEQQIAELSQMLESEQYKEQTKIQVAQINAQSKAQIEQMKQQSTQFVEQMKAQVKAIDQQIAQEKNEISKRELYMQREALSHTIAEAERRMTMEEIRFEQEMNQPVPEEEEAGEFVEGLRDPSSGKPIESMEGNPASKTSDNMAGVISRGEYGNIPGKEG